MQYRSAQPLQLNRSESEILLNGVESSVLHGRDNVCQVTKTSRLLLCAVCTICCENYTNCVFLLFCFSEKDTPGFCGRLMRGSRARYGRRHVTGIQRTSIETTSIPVITNFLLYVLYTATCFGIHIVQIQQNKAILFQKL